MLLKSLEIQGFKTFPEKTKLSFDKGITAVVGPNGSGKSNISDAIRWVLGEQSPKALRCSKMEDVVFNGTDNRKKHGFAEVTLTIQNKDRELPFNGDEVAVTRRYYRSGDSEYLINKAAVRLKDVHELFMDTGLGRDGYSMIGQGKIDSIVASKSEDRREIFEEAAGISRYRYRKTEAERKLKSTEENLLRLRDIVTELEERVGPLSIQAKKAEDFLKYSKEKRGLDIALCLNTLEKSADVLREQEEKISIARAQHQSAEQQLEKISKETEEIFLKNGEFSSKIDEIRRQISASEEIVGQRKASISVAENNILHNNQNIERLKKEIEAVDSNSKNIEKEIEEKKQKNSELETAVKLKQKSYDSCADELNEINVNASRSSDLLQQMSLTLTKLSAKAADIRVNEMTSASSITELENRISTLTYSKETKEKQLVELNTLKQHYEVKLTQYSENVDMLTNAIKGCELKLQGKQKKRDTLKTQADKLTLDSNEMLRRAKVLQDLENNLEGFNHSVKLVVKEASRNNLSGIHGPVSRVITVPSSYNVAIETALGAAMQNIVTSTEEDAKKAISFLKQRDGGRATFLPLSTIKGNQLNENGLQACSGFVGIASQLCTCDEKYNGVLYSLLGRIAVAENLNAAVAIAKRFNYRFRVVTLDGQVVNAGGSLTGGSLNRKSGLLSRVTEIEKFKKQGSELAARASETIEELGVVQASVAKLEADLLGTKADLARAQEEKIKMLAEAKSCETETESVSKSLADVKSELNSCSSRITNLSTAHENAVEQLEKLNQQIAEAEKSSLDISGSREQLTAKRESLSNNLQEIRLEIVTAQKDIDTINSEINLAINTGNNQDTRKAGLQQEIFKYENDNKEIQSQISALNSETDQIKADINTAKSSIQSLITQRTDFEKRTSFLRQQEKDKLSEKELAGRELARLEEREINLKKQYDDIISKLWEEYELTRREAENEAVQIDNVAAAQKRLNELKSKIRGLGSVNVSAIEEYKEVSERYEFLSKQVADVEKSKLEILRLIGDLTKQMRDLFVSRFHEINENFTATFKELFGGGTASLELANPEDMLTSGIDIIVHPPGKLVNHLEALSGGEKALVAIALYFAIMKVSPAPFCVLDEIEAALDDVNVDRFASYMRRMNNNTQFIAITHRRGTMEEADVLYGVTMQEQGISKLLELRASEVASKLGMKTN